jgi:hypothetical protein
MPRPEISMGPIRVKYYGLLAMTKTAYLTATAVASLIAAAVLVAAHLTGHLPPFHWPWERVPKADAVGIIGLLYNHLYDIILVCLVLEAIDLVVTLRAFARKEAEQRAAVAVRESTLSQ